MNSFYPGDDETPQTDHQEQTPAPPPAEPFVPANPDTDEDTVTTDDDDPGRDVTSVPDPKRKGR